MDDFDGQESTSDLTESPELTAEVPTEDHSTTSSESNPFWGEVEQKVGPNVWQLIKPDLDKADTAARQRVESLNQSYAPWKELADQNISPDQVKQAIGVVHQLNTAPEQVFESLRSFLEREGRMPSQAELKQEVIEDENEAQAPAEDPRFNELQEKFNELQGFLQNQFQAQAQQAADKEADAWLDSEVTRLSDPKNGYDKGDIQEIIRIAAFASQQTGQDPDLDAAAAQFNALRDRIRTAPRPGQTAPRLPGGPGGTPQQNTDPASMSRDERRAAVAAILQRGQQS